MKLLVATTNQGKLNEYRDLLSDLNVEWVTLRDIGLDHLHVEETADTFAGNAILKAEAYGSASGLLTLADDSGLEVDALDGRPGLYSARYGAPELKTDPDRYERILAELGDLPLDRRTARFRCVVAIAAPQKPIQTTEGIVEGKIAFAARGSNGFGYDPIFLMEDGRTYAELPAQDKNRLSHRGKALEKAHSLLIGLIKKMDI